MAYVIPKQKPAPTAHEVRRLLQEKLPSYMIPSAFMYLESLPLTPNGKVDRRALPDPHSQDARDHNEYVGPRDETERVMCRVWSEVLALNRIGLDDRLLRNRRPLTPSYQIVCAVGSRVRAFASVRRPVQRSDRTVAR